MGILFDGVDDFINCGGGSGDPFDFGTGAFSLLLQLTIGNGEHRIMGTRNSDWSTYYGFYQGALAGDSLRFYTTGGNLTSGIDISDGNPHHLVATRDSSGNTAIYVDGVQKSTGNDSSANVSGDEPFSIGKWGTYTENYIEGLVNEGAAWNVDLSQAEVEQLRAQTGATLKLVREVIANQRRRSRLEELEAKLARIPDPLEEMQRQADKTAFILVYQANQMYDELNQKDSAIQTYNRVIELFPQSKWADVARQRLLEMQNNSVNNAI